MKWCNIEMVQKERNSNYEMLRILSMLLIVMSHCDEIFGLSDLYGDTLGVYKMITDWLHIGGQIGVGCFLLISGYFMVDKKIDLKKILKIWGEVVFYTILIWIIWIIYQLISGDFDWISAADEISYALFPVLSGHYWFITAYIILMILSPYINILLQALTKTQYQAFLASCIIILVLLRGGIPGILAGMFEGRMYPVILMYIIAGYIKRFVAMEAGSFFKHICIAFSFYILMFMSFYMITYWGLKLKDNSILDMKYFYRELNSPFTVIVCVELFIGFGSLKEQYNKTINTIAGATLGVYLLHSNRLLEKGLHILFPLYKEQNPILLILYSLFAVLIIYFMGTVIDLIRKKSVEKIWLRFLNRNIEERVK